MRALNPEVLRVEAQGRQPLPPGELVARVEAATGERASGLWLDSRDDSVARVFLAPPPGERRGPMKLVDPYSGELLGQPSGEGFFRFVLQLHRWLAAGEVGKQVVGASTLALLFFCASGLYRRWPRRWASLRAWFHLDTRLGGRRFLWHLHSVVATWLLVPYLLMALTGLWWSYGWYREGVNSLAGLPAQAMRGGAGGVPVGRDAGPVPVVDVAAAFAAFDAEVPAWSTRTLRLPAAAGAPVEFNYQDPNPAHERANHRLVLDAGSLAVAAHERFGDKPAGQRFVAAMFPLHSGSWFGGAGLFVFCLASLAMPLFTITGVQLYLDRRAKKRAGEDRRRARELALARRSAG